MTQMDSRNAAARGSVWLLARHRYRLWRMGRAGRHSGRAKRWSFGPFSRRPPWLYICAGSVLPALVAAAFLIKPFAKWIDAAHKANDVAFDFVSAIVTPPLLFATGYLVFLVWTYYRVCRRYLRNVKRDPAEYVPTAGSILDEVVGRDQLIHVLMEDLRNTSSRRPNVLVGGVGTGKTAVLVRLSAELARRGAVPIALKLRGVTSDQTLNFRQLAKEQLERQLQSYVFSAAELDRIWLQLNRDNQMVILADGLEECLVDSPTQPPRQQDAGHERENAIRLAIHQAYEEQLPLVIASRPHDPLRAMNASITELEPIGEIPVLEYVTQGATDEEYESIVRLVQEAEVAECPLYLQLIRELLRYQELQKMITEVGSELPSTLRVADRAGLRLRLLKTWRHAVENGYLYDDSALDSRLRRYAMYVVSALACLGLKEDSIEVPLAKLTGAEPEDEPAALEVSAGAMPLVSEATGDAREHDGTDGARSVARLELYPGALRAFGDRLGAMGLSGSTVNIDLAGAVGRSVTGRGMLQVEVPTTAPRLDPGGEGRPGPESGLERALRDRIERHGGGVSLHDPGISVAATMAAELGVVELGQDSVRFRHSVLQAYLASRFLPDALTDHHFAEQAFRSPSREFLIALVLASRDEHRTVWGGAATRADWSSRQVDELRKAIERLDERHEESEQHRIVKKLDMYAAALEIDSPYGDSHPDLVRNVQRLWSAGRGGRAEVHQPFIRDRNLEEAKLRLLLRLGDAARTRCAAERRERRTSGVVRPVPDDRRVAAYTSLYEMAVNEHSYRVRLGAAQQIAEGGNDAYTQIARELKPALTSWGTTAGHPIGGAAAQDHAGDRYREQTLRAWLAPMLCGTTANDPIEDTDVQDRALEHLDTWLARLGRRDPRHGTDPLAIPVEIALAQGFKHAANRRAASPDARARLAEKAETALRRSRYWFSHLTLIQALALLSLPQDTTSTPPARGHGSNCRALVRRWRRAAGCESTPEPHDRRAAGGRHPLVREAARLAYRAMLTWHPERYCWIDERGTMNRIGSYHDEGSRRTSRRYGRRLWIPDSLGWKTLDRRAQRLLADVLLMQNLADRDGGAGRREAHLERAVRTDLPPCMTRDRSPLNMHRTVGSGSTSNPGSTCADECEFGLCPYPAKGELHNEDELGEGFCRQQETLIRFYRPLARWQQAMSHRSLKAFWRTMSVRTLPAGSAVLFGSAKGRRKAKARG